MPESFDRKGSPNPVSGTRYGHGMRDTRGRLARWPWEISARGWLDILHRVYHELWEDRVMLVAAGVSFYMLLALTPALSATLSIYGLISDPEIVARQISLIEPIVPAAATQTIRDQLTTVAEAPDETLGLTLVISFATALWLANNGVKALFEAMNVAYEENEKRSFVLFTVVTLLTTVGAILLFCGTMLVIVALPALLPLLGLPGSEGRPLQLAGAAVLFVATLTGVVLLYRWGPSRRAARWRWLIPGAVLSVVIGAIASSLFSWYLANFGAYDRTYGSLGAIIAFMTWIWLMATLLLMGAELNAEIEHQTTRDSTIGPGRPMGRRGAWMADTVGHPREAADETEHENDPGRPRFSITARDTPDARRARLRDPVETSVSALVAGYAALAVLGAASKMVREQDRRVAGTFIAERLRRASRAAQTVTRPHRRKHDDHRLDKERDRRCRRADR